MKVKVERISQMKDGKTWSQPSEGHMGDLEIDLNGYEEIASSSGPLPDSDESWPRGAPFLNMFRYKDRIYRKKIDT